MNKVQLDYLDKVNEKNKERRKSLIRENLKFSPHFRLPKNIKKLKLMFPFSQSIFKNYTNNLNDFKGVLLLFTLIYNTCAFSNDYFKIKSPNRKIIFMKQSDFQTLFGYKTKPFFIFEPYKKYFAIPLIPETLTSAQKEHDILKHLSDILPLFNKDMPKDENYIKRRKEKNLPDIIQYKCFNFNIIMSFLNKFKKHSIPFLLYFLSLYKYCNKPIIKHNLMNVLRLSEIPLRPSKKSAIDRINSYFKFLKENKIITDKTLKEYTIEDLKETKSLNIHLQLF